MAARPTRSLEEMPPPSAFAALLGIEVETCTPEEVVCSMLVTEAMGNRNGVFALAIDPQMFATRGVFLRHVNEFVERLKACDTMPGVDEILMPGERSQRVREQRLKNGIPIEPSVWQEITRIMDELGLTHP